MKSAAKQKTVCTIIGNRPHFIKWAPLSPQIRKHFREVVIHTGQHYDQNMSDVFFKEMNLAKPDHNLAVRAKTHAQQTGRIKIRLEPLLQEIRPACMIVFGDTNTTLAAAITAAKLKIPIAHIEAGVRMREMNTPEEINRRCVDHLAAFNFCPHRMAYENLQAEGRGHTAHVVGDVMYDAFLHFQPISLRRNSKLLAKLHLEPGQFIFMSLHRPDNVDDPAQLGSILQAIVKADMPVLFAVHPRTHKHMTKRSLYSMLKNTGVKTIPAVGYLESLFFLSHCQKVLTDSGGLQKEAYFAGKPCVILSNDSPWMELVEMGWNYITALDPAKITYGLDRIDRPMKSKNIYGNGDSSSKIACILKEMI